jgi:hypothetical protein
MNVPMTIRAVRARLEPPFIVGVSPVLAASVLEMPVPQVTGGFLWL